MANVSQGLSATWNGVTLGELVSVNVDGVSAETVDATPRNHQQRNKIFSVADTDLGTVSITLRGTNGMTATNVGLTGTLSITGPGAAWSFTGAIFEKLGWSASVGELQTYSVTFKIGA